MSNEESAAAYAATRRSPRQGASPSPVGSTLSIVLALVAVVAGFLILRNLTDDGSASAGPGDVGAEEPAEDDPSLPDVTIELPDQTTTTTSTTVPLITTGATVVVANANTVGGSAGAMTRTLELEGFTMGDPVNATGPNLQESIVHYDSAQAGALDVANSVAFVLGGLSVSELPTPVPVDGGELDGGVLVLLGDNEAGKTAAELQEAAAAEAGPAVADAPEVSGADATTDATTDDAATDDAATDDAATDE